MSMIITLITAASSSSSSTSCDIPCQNEGQCIVLSPPPEVSASSSTTTLPPSLAFLQQLDMLKEVNFVTNSSFDETNNDGRRMQMMCDCPKGYAGSLCEIENVVECGSKHPGAEASGEDVSYCFHGGTCVEKKYGPDNGRTFCDCSTTTLTDEYDGTPFGVSIPGYVGRYCEHPVERVCDEGALTNNGYMVCANGGTCQETGLAYQGCDCADGLFGGVACEYDLSNPLTYEFGLPETCELECFNGGICRKGAGSLAMYDEALQDTDFNLFRDAYNSNFEHCVCPPGYMGLTCEIPMEVCGADDDNNDDETQPSFEHICLHGSKCRPHNEDRNTPWECDCSEADMMVAGDYCQAKITTHCGSAPNAFCTNGGHCKSYAPIGGDRFEGCKCDPPFMGFHCEHVEPYDQCYLDCGLHGDCRPNPNHPQGIEGAYFYQDFYCACHEGYGGDECEIQLDFCAASTTYNRTCYNGGVCRVKYDGVNDDPHDPTLITDPTFCDCRNSRDPSTGNPLSGPTCETRPTDVCETASAFVSRLVEGGEKEKEEEGDKEVAPAGMVWKIQLPCYNGGTCKKDGIYDLMECMCPDGFDGETCEIDLDGPNDIIHDDEPSVMEGIGSLRNNNVSDLLLDDDQITPFDLLDRSSSSAVSLMSMSLMYNTISIISMTSVLALPWMVTTLL